MLAQLIGRIARGRHASEHLSEAEAQQAFAALLKADVDPLQLGAFLIAQRMKGETVEELAGFVRAARQSSPLSVNASSQRHGWVDLPCYAGKRRAAAAHLVAALRWRQQGGHVLVHGVADIAGRCSAWQCLQQAGVARAKDSDDAASLVQRDGIAYLDLAEACPPLMRIYTLRDRLGVRSFANSVARLLNPLQCAGQLNGVFHTPYVERMAKVNRLLGQTRSMIFMGAEGEPELYTERQKQVMQQCEADIRPLSMHDLDAECYPRKVIGAEQTLAQFKQWLESPVHITAAARIQRSLDALQWAGGDT